MERNTLLIQSRITPEVFREFALFDTMYRRKQYRRPLLFAAIMAAFACVCFAQQSRSDQAVLLGAVLLAVGLSLPTAYILFFLYSVHKKSKQLNLKDAPAAYTVTLSPERVVVTAGRERAEYAWKDLLYVYRIRHSTCLYVGANRAYLLPASDRREEDKLWALISERTEKRRDLRK